MEWQAYTRRSLRLGVPFGGLCFFLELHGIIPEYLMIIETGTHPAMAMAWEGYTTMDNEGCVGICYDIGFLL